MLIPTPIRRLLPVLLLAVLGTGVARAGDADTETLHYGIEMQGVLCGYSTVEISPLQTGGEDLLEIKQHMFLMITALGSKFNSDMQFTWHVEPDTGRWVYHESFIDQGGTRLNSTVRIAENVATCASSLDEEVKKVELSPDVVLENGLFFPHLERDFIEGDSDEETYRIFEVFAQEIQPSTVTRKGEETVRLADRQFQTVVLERRNLTTGVRMTQYLDKKTARVIRVDIPPARKAFLADASVAKRIEVANLDASLTTRTNTLIPDVSGISYMKVRAVCEPTGSRVAPAGLTVPGQTFTGTVVENRIEGVFEIEHPRYDGTGAPPFRPDFSGDPKLSKYLDSDGFITASDPVVRERAREITQGATTSWEASRRLAQWVSDNIDYAIPGGVTARKTLDTRTGECSSHSILFAAFCRALGIPARVVWGCMYIPNQGGAFGQHAWNEVYMGPAGWIPLDTTAAEIDFVDSGHIRIGEYEAFSTGVSLREVEVLAHRVGAGPDAGAAPAAVTAYDPYIGEYADAESGLVIRAAVQNGALVAEIVGQVSLVLNDPDENGAWTAKMSSRVYITFEKDDSGRAEECALHEIVRMQRQAAPEEFPETVPPEFRPYLGTYLLAPVRATFEVIYREDGLAVKDPLAGKTIGLRTPDAQGRFLDEFGKNTIRFEAEDDGKVRALVIDAVRRFQRSADAKNGK